MNMAEWIAYWRANPDSFVNSYLGIRLYWYQRLFLRLIWNWRLHGIYNFLL